METNTAFIINVLLPCVIALIIFGLGLTLRAEDFLRVLKEPKAVAIGLIFRIVALPMIAFGLAKLFDLTPAFSIGLLLLAACPGSVMANVFSSLGRGDLALTLTLTALNNVLAALTLPLVIGFSLRVFNGESQPVEFQAAELLKIFLILIVPVALGILVRARAPLFAARAERRLKVISILFLVFLVAGAVAKERLLLLDNFAQLGGVVVAFNLLSLALGFAVAKLTRLSQAQAVSISMSSGIASTALCITIAAAILKNVTYAMPAAIYSLTMYVAAGTMIALLKFFQPKSQTPTNV